MPARSRVTAATLTGWHDAFLAGQKRGDHDHRDDHREVERDTRQVRITPVGEEVVARARQLLAEAQDLMILAKRAAEHLDQSSDDEERRAVIGDLADDLLGQIVVQQHQVQVGVRQEFASAEASGCDDREAGRHARGGDREHRHRRAGDDPRRGEEP